MSRSYTVLQTVTANDAQVTVVTPGLIVDTTGTGGNAITITGAGKLGAKEPSADDHTDIEAGFRVVEALGRLDVGQAAVVVKGYVLAVEAAEGTDEMLARCAELRRAGQGRLERAGVLVKAPKPGQEERVDLPTIGPETIKGAAAAGLAGIAVTAKHVLIADRAATIAAADAHEIFIFGRRPSEPHG